MWGHVAQNNIKCMTCSMSSTPDWNITAYRSRRLSVFTNGKNIHTDKKSGKYITDFVILDNR